MERGAPYGNLYQFDRRPKPGEPGYCGTWDPPAPYLGDPACPRPLAIVLPFEPRAKPRRNCRSRRG